MDSKSCSSSCGSEEGPSLHWGCSWHRPVETAQGSAPGKHCRVKPTARPAPGWAHQGQRPAGAQDRRCWSSTRASGQRSRWAASPVGAAGKEQLVQPEASWASSCWWESIVTGSQSHPASSRPWSPFPAETFHPLSVCLLPPTVCSVSGRVTGQTLSISSLRGLELGVPDR